MSLNWDESLLRFSSHHILQTSEWGKLKKITGWVPFQLSYPRQSDYPEALSLVLKRQLHIGGFDTRSCILYVPKGPVLDWDNPSARAQVFSSLENFARNQQAVFIKIDPDVVLGYGLPGSDGVTATPSGQMIEAELTTRYWKQSSEQIQFRNTILIDLTQDDETILEGMKQKTRYNIRLSERKGIKIRFGSIEDLDLLFQVYAETSIRDGFVIRDKDYYLQMWSTFLNADMADILLAEYEGEFTAGLVLYRFGTKAWYMYGMSRNLHREKMPTYLLQWHAIQRAKQKGCSVYDLWGAPEEFNEKDPLWGVFRFKEGFGGKVVRTIGAWDFPVQMTSYWLYTKVMPFILNLMRNRGKNQTERLLNT